MNKMHNIMQAAIAQNQQSVEKASFFNDLANYRQKRYGSVLCVPVIDEIYVIKTIARTADKSE